jgi:hypothetical protein
VQTSRVGHGTDGEGPLGIRSKSGPSAGVPFIAFAGNVGDNEALADALDLLWSR